MSINIPSFERAEYKSESSRVDSQCVRCGQALAGRFFRISDASVCESCANSAVTSHNEGAGSAFFKAIAVGLGAAILGSVVYAGVEIATGWTIGYVALAVGWLVGKSMRWGSDGRGGRKYQIAAGVLTYLSVSFASVFVILHAVQKRNPDMHLAFTQQFGLFVVKYGLLSPLLELGNGLGGIIGLFILFIGVRTAWSMMAGSEFPIISPPEGTTLL